MGLAKNICRAAVGAVPCTSVLPASCQQCKVCSDQIGVSVTLTLICASWSRLCLGMQRLLYIPAL